MANEKAGSLRPTHSHDRLRGLALVLLAVLVALPSLVTRLVAALIAVAATATPVVTVVIQGKCSLSATCARDSIVRAVNRPLALASRLTLPLGHAKACRVLRAACCRGRALTAVSAEFRSLAQRFAPFAIRLSNA